MSRAVLAAVVLAALPLGSRAADAVVRLAVRPMAAPKPALKYHLLPEVGELKPGNPVQWYVRCFQEQRVFFFGKEANADRARYRSMPLSELPADKLRRYGGGALTQADWGARLETPDWQVLDRVQAEGTEMTSPELGPLHVLAMALQVRFRAEVAGRHFDDALGTAKTMLALARHLGEHPTGAANRVGLSVAQLALDTLQEAVQQPGCPNLYWALTDLPSPLVELRKGAQGDRALAAADLRPIRDDAPMTGAEIEKTVSHLAGVMGLVRLQAGLEPRNPGAILEARANDVGQVRAARARLVGSGLAEDLVRKFPPAQVILLDEKRDFEGRRDEERKLLGLPPWQGEALARAAGPGRGGDALFADLLPDPARARRALGRLEQRVALLRHVEALRLYAAAHGGKLPEKLADVPVPLPSDPFTGKPFAYKAEGNTAHLRGGPDGDAVRYEVTVPK
jgi:hypothetical protein